MNTEELMKRFGQQEPLNPELEPYIGTTDFGMPMLRHPLIYSIPYFQADNARLNMYYEQKLQMLKKAIKNKDWSSYIFLHERPYRLNAFTDVIDDLKDKEYWQLLGEIWIDSENIWQNKTTWKALLSSIRKHKEYFMTKEDRKNFNELPESITIYRGYIERKNKKGFSYTMDKEKAEWFSRRFGNKNAGVIEKNIRKQDAFAYLNGRNENEIIYLK